MKTGARRTRKPNDLTSSVPVSEAIEDETLRAMTEQIEHLKASIRAAVEHPFRVVKRQFGHVKARYRGLAKNGAQMLTLFALSNLWMSRKHLLGMTG